jgi:hypothetical protein
MNEEDTGPVISSVQKPSVQKPSYASITSKNVPSSESDECAADFTDFTVVKKKIMKKCETAVLEWAKRQTEKPISMCRDEELRDEELICNRCALPFVFSMKTKEKYAERGWKIPKICKICSQTRFEERKYA